MKKELLLILLFYQVICIVFIYSLAFPTIPEYILHKKLLDLTLEDILPILVYSLKISILLPLFLYATHVLVNIIAKGR